MRKGKTLALENLNSNGEEEVWINVLHKLNMQEHKKVLFSILKRYYWIFNASVGFITYTSNSTVFTQWMAIGEALYKYKFWKFNNLKSTRETCN